MVFQNFVGRIGASAAVYPPANRAIGFLLKFQRQSGSVMPKPANRHATKQSLRSKDAAHRRPPRLSRSVRLSPTADPHTTKEHQHFATQQQQQRQTSDYDLAHDFRSSQHSFALQSFLLTTYLASYTTCCSQSAGLHFSCHPPNSQVHHQPSAPEEADGSGCHPPCPP